ncbi:MAG: shikimate dehydrogenase [Paludibacteraceae bacterium]|nr:shikimate dehydrogenase [Paludibacteraceae bacterium]
MRKFGLIGKTLVHSFSKKYFTEKFEREAVDANYELYSIANVDSLRQFVQEHSLCGLNVTIPYKQDVIPLLDEIDSEAQMVGAVNVIKIKREGERLCLKGFNTDVVGFRNSLKPLLKPWHTSALVLGTGGASKAVLYVLENLGIAARCVSRQKREGMLTYETLDADVMRRNTLIVNTTPLGTFPNVETCPDIPYRLLTEKHMLFDLVYNPEQTLFMKKGLQNGAAVKNGYEMLVGQAEASWRIWNL